MTKQKVTFINMLVFVLSKLYIRYNKIVIILNIHYGVIFLPKQYRVSYLHTVVRRDAPQGTHFSLVQVGNRTDTQMPPVSHPRCCRQGWLMTPVL